jgi:hypothetical protein
MHIITGTGIIPLPVALRKTQEKKGTIMRRFLNALKSFASSQVTFGMVAAVRTPW